jgi:hypothetical protein
VENEIIIIYALFVVVLIVFTSYRWFCWHRDVVVGELIKLFEEDEKKWWGETKLPKAIGRSDFATREALKLLDGEKRLRERIVSNDSIRVYSLYPQVDEGRSLQVRLVQLDSLK